MSYPKASSLSTNALFMIPRLSIDKFAGYAFLAVPDIFLRTAGNDPSAIFASLWPHIDEIICAADHIQIMFNNDDRCSVIDQRCKYLKQGSTSFGCSPMVGSSKTKTESVCLRPISLASFKRCASPPESDGVSSPSVR